MAATWKAPPANVYAADTLSDPYSNHNEYIHKSRTATKCVTFNRYPKGPATNVHRHNSTSKLACVHKNRLVDYTKTHISAHRHHSTDHKHAPCVRCTHVAMVRDSISGAFATNAWHQLPLLTAPLPYVLRLEITRSINTHIPRTRARVCGSFPRPEWRNVRQKNNERKQNNHEQQKSLLFFREETVWGRSGQSRCRPQSIGRLKAEIRPPVERSAVLDLQFGAVEAGVARYYSSRSIIEADRHSILKRVADTLGAVGIHDLGRLYTADDGVFLENAVL